MKKEKLLLISIVIFAAILRFYQLGKNPPHLNWDEAAIGYNAYSLLKTGKDEYGTKFPLSFRSFDDYKPPLYFYLTIPSIALFGLNDWAVRFPSAFLGTLTVLLTYFLVKELFKIEIKKLPASNASRRDTGWRNEEIKAFKTKNKKYPNIPISQSRQTRSQYPNILPEVTALLLAISPWHLQFSRVAFEANMALFFVVLGVWLFLKGVKNPLFLLLSSISFIMSLYSYHSPRVFVPLLVLCLFLPFRKKLLKNLRYSLSALVIAIIFCLPLVKIMTSTEGQMRIHGTSAFADPENLILESKERIYKDQQDGFLFANLLHHRLFVYMKIALRNYLYHLNLNWLFVEDNAYHHHVPGIGLLYLWELPFFLYGCYKLLKNKPGYYQIILFWLLLSPIPAAPTIDLPHAIRVFNMVIPLLILTAYGICTFPKRRFLLAGCFLLFFNFIFYLHQYYVHLPFENSSLWQFGRREMVLTAKDLKEDYDKIIVSTELEKSYIFFLYYLQYDPQEYLKLGGTVSGGFAETRNRLDKYYFRPIDWENDPKENSLLIGRTEEFPDGAPVLKTIHYLNGEEAIKFVSY